MSFLRTVYLYNSLQNNIKRSREEILKLREKKLKKILKFALNNIPFYKEYYGSFGITIKNIESMCISELPKINKNILMENFNKFFKDSKINKQIVENFLSNNPDPRSLLFNKYYVVHSSGTSGTVGYYLYGKKEWDFIKAISTRMFPQFDLRKKKYAFIGAVDGHYAAISLFLSPINQVEQYFYKDYLIMDINKPIKSYIDVLNKFKPDNLTGYPNGIKSIALYQKQKILNVNPETIVTGGEPLFKETKLILKEAWPEAKIVNSYATSESLAMGVSREDLDYMYLYDDAVYVEIEKEGLLLTNLYNYTQPLIRYEISDILKPVEKENTMWPFTPIEDVVGRNELIPYFINEKKEKDFIHPIVIAEFFVKGVNKFQFVQTGLDTFTFRIVVSKDKDLNSVLKDTKMRLQNILEKKQMKNVKFTIEVVEDIRPDEKTGKYNLVKIEF